MDNLTHHTHQNAQVVKQSILKFHSIISNTFSESIFCIHGIFWPEIIHGENAHGAY